MLYRPVPANINVPMKKENGHKKGKLLRRLAFVLIVFWLILRACPAIATLGLNTVLTGWANSLPPEGYMQAPQGVTVPATVIQTLLTNFDEIAHHEGSFTIADITAWKGGNSQIVAFVIANMRALCDQSVDAKCTRVTRWSLTSYATENHLPSEP